MSLAANCNEFSIVFREGRPKSEKYVFLLHSVRRAMALKMLRMCSNNSCHGSSRFRRMAGLSRLLLQLEVKFPPS